MSYWATLLSKYKKSIMGLAALIIYYYHNHAVFLMDIGPFGVCEDFFKQIFFFGVEIFMLLSGIGIVSSLKKNNTAQFYLNRFLRV